jgi:hypothetical protein
LAQVIAAGDRRHARVSDLLFPGRALWAALVVIIAVDIAWLAWSDHFFLKLSSLFAFLPSVALLAGLALYFQRHGGAASRKLYEPLMGTLFVIAGFMAVRVFNHLAMSIPFPFVDDELAALDGLLGLDWLAYTTWVSHHPWIVLAFQTAYTGITLVTVAVFAILFVVIGSERARELCRLVFWTSLATTIIGVAFPAHAAMDRFASTGLRLVFGPDAGIYPIPYIAAARGEGADVLDLSQLPGLTAMPSFHTICGLLIVYSCRGHRLLWPIMLVYATVMIASTPIMGGHYFVDLIAGALLTVVAIAVDRLYADRVERIAGMRPYLAVQSGN